MPGRTALETRLKSLREELDVDLCVVNGENAADGVGLTPKLARKLLEFGADAITLGNHAWRRPDLAPWIDSEPRVVRPANFSRHAPGRGLTVVPARDDTPVAVINVMGSLFLDVACGPFEVIDDLVDEARAQTPVILVDMHAEATSEKVALSRWLDGRVTAVFGTHTHIQTNDARVQPGGTAALTDAGMTGPHDSVIGVVGDQAISTDAHRPACSLRDGAKRRADRGSARRVRHRRPRYALRDDPRAGSLTARTSVASSASRTRSRAKHEPRDARVELAHEIPVAEREPELRQDERGGEHGVRARPPGEDDDGNEPDQELRREHLPERDEGGQGRRGIDRQLQG